MANKPKKLSEIVIPVDLFQISDGYSWDGLRDRLKDLPTQEIEMHFDSCTCDACAKIRDEELFRMMGEGLAHE